MKRTPLYDAHREAGGRMVDFAGWEMPVRYSGVLAEHRAVRSAAGLFDVSHMGEIEVSGDGARDVCQRLTVNDVDRLEDGRAQYSMFCQPDGGVIDDVILYRLAEGRYLFCVNAANRATDFAWVSEHGAGAQVIDRGDDYAQIAVQGPRATALVQRLTEVDLGAVPAFAFVDGVVAGGRALIAHTGYTGENGWELYCAPADALALWRALLTAGEDDGVVPAGLGARDTLRLESALPLYGHELSRSFTPLEARLGWVLRFDCGDFIGREALSRQKTDGVRRRLVGLKLLDRGVPRQGYPILAGGKPVGHVTSGTSSPTLHTPIALGYVPVAQARVGTALEVEIRGRALAAEVVPIPFYKRAR